MFHAYDQIRVGTQGQILQRFLQVTRTYLAGSTGAVNGLGQADIFRFGNHFSVLWGFLWLASRIRIHEKV
jgi:hypothetical protein